MRANTMRFNRMLVMVTAVLSLIIGSFAVFAQEQPPSLENHQFYGEVYWDVTAKDPVNVIARAGTASFSSAVKKVSCFEKTCTGTYGKDADNILRVQATTGAAIDFYLDAKKVSTAMYKAGKVTVYTINVATNPVLTCADPDWKCTDWSACSGGKQTRTCTDEKKCNPEQLTKAETQSCGSVTGKTTATQKSAGELATCTYQWDCTGWSTCVNDQQTQTCTKVDDCDAQFAAGTVDVVEELSKPAELKSCITGVTGSLPAKTTALGTPPSVGTVTPPAAVEEAEETEGLSVWVYVGITVIVIGVIGVWLALRRKKEGAVGYQF